MVRKEFLNSFVIALLLIASAAIQPTFAKTNEKNANNKQKINKVQTNDVYAPMDINNIFNYYSNDGDGSFNPNKTDNEGFEFPIGSGVGTCIFEDGLVWTAFKQGTLLCGGSTYNHGLQAGRILTDGTASTLPTADDPGKAEYRIYRVRPDIKPSTDPTVQASETSILNTSEVPYFNRSGITGNASASDLYTQYTNDWTQWPASEGAPFTDANGVAHLNGGAGYDPATCVPGFPGADQTEWMVMNDVNSSRTIALYSSNPIGIEVQRTIWAYNRPGALGNTIFISYKFINRSGVPLDSMWVAQWCDPDLGFAGDDATGCDTTRSLGYVYNGVPTDANFSSLNLAPPSAGFDFFQGPTVTGAPTDSAIVNMRRVGGKKNLPMTAFTFFINGNATFGDPELHSNGPDGTAQWFNLMRGLVSTTGQPFPASVTGGTNFCYWGDPVTGVGPTYIGPAKVSPPADVRMCLISGPFNMAAGDTQQVVVAALAADGSDNVSSVSLLKYYDDIAQTAYNFFFNLPSAPPAPKVNAVALDGKIVLSWGDDPAYNQTEENFSDKGYDFQGYNVYQLPTSSTSGAKRIATYDLTTSQGIIEDLAYDPTTGFVITKPVQFGTRQGLQHSMTVSQDAFSSAPIVNDRDYYFAVTAYSYNGSGVEPNNLESPISGHIVDVRAQTEAPGYTAPDEGTFSNVTHTAGISNGVVTVNVVDPSLVTGDQYQVSFHNETYSLGPSQVWTDVTASSKAKRLMNPQDLTGSSISSTASWSERVGSIDVHYLVDVVSPNYDFCDGVKLTFPAGVTIDTTYMPVSNNTGNQIPFYYDRVTNSIFYGDSAVQSSDTTLRTGNGVFAGGEDILVTVHPSTVPLIVKYTMYDDNFGATYQDSADGFPFGQLVDISSQDTLTSISNKVVTQHQWNVTDLTTKKVVLANQTIYSGADLYDQAAYSKANGIDGPGGSSGTLQHGVGVAPAPFDGLTAAITGSFDPPINYSQTVLSPASSPTTLTHTAAPSAGIDLNNYTIFSGVVSSKAIDNYGFGTDSLSQLQKGYELRFTGVWDSTTVGSQKVYYVKSGGQIATCFSMDNTSDLANNPLNHAATAAPFLIRVPFEVWSIDDNRQVNFMYRDRARTGTENPFYSWNLTNRVYGIVVNSKYDSTSVITTAASDPKNALATWVWVFYSLNYNMHWTGSNYDKIDIYYPKPLVVGKDLFTFTVPKIAYSATQAKTDIAKINIFPNPYFGFNRLETSKYNRWVRFTHLPLKNVTIRIFNLAGILVRTLVKPDDGTQFMDWNLLNEYQLPVAAGMYIAYVDCGAVGTKTLKFAIIPEQQFLDHY